jgi:hypothetical protein
MGSFFFKITKHILFLLHNRSFLSSSQSYPNGFLLQPSADSVMPTNTGAAVAGLTGGATAPEKSRCCGFINLFDFRDKSALSLQRIRLNITEFKLQFEEKAKRTQMNEREENE